MSKLDQKPLIQKWQQDLRMKLNDFIERMNVYDFDGKDKFIAHYEEEVTEKLLSQYPEVRGLSERLEYYKGLAMLSIFGVDPENESLEQEK